jgi:hypothetical protein
MDRPDRLRREPSYRTYVRALRFGLSGFVLAVIFGLLGKAAITGGAVRAVSVLLPMLVTFVSVIAGGIAWVIMPDKQRINAHQWSFLAMVARDIVKGIPKRLELR